MNIDRAYIAAIERENDELREQVARLEDVLTADFVSPIEWCLTGSESRLFGALLARQLLTKDMALAVLYRDLGKDEPAMKIIDVFVCKLRKKLKLFGIDIQTVWGRGYMLDAQTRSRLRQEIEARAA